MKWIAALLLSLAPSGATDWAFLEAQETFVTEAVGFRSAVASLPADQRSLLASMSSDDWRHREWASREMLARGKGAVRACFVGQGLGDHEVRLRCRNILRRISACPGCDGRGGRDESWGRIMCALCVGVGHFWPIEDFE